MQSVFHRVYFLACLLLSPCCSQHLATLGKQSQGDCAIHAVHAPPATLSPCRRVFLSKLIQHLRAICATILRQGHGDNLTGQHTDNAWLGALVKAVRMANLQDAEKTCESCTDGSSIAVISNLVEFERGKLCFTIGSINSG